MHTYGDNLAMGTITPRTPCPQQGNYRMRPTLAIKALKLPAPDRLCWWRHPRTAPETKDSLPYVFQRRKNPRPALEISSLAIVSVWQSGPIVNKRRRNIPLYTCLGFSGWFSWTAILALQQYPSCSAPRSRAGLNRSV